MLSVEEHISWFMTMFCRTNMYQTSDVVIDLYELVKAKYDTDSRLLKHADNLLKLAYDSMLNGHPMLLRKFLYHGHTNGLIHRCIGLQFANRVGAARKPHTNLKRFLAAAG